MWQKFSPRVNLLQRSKTNGGRNKDTSVGRPVEENEEITQTLREFWKQESPGLTRGVNPQMKTNKMSNLKSPLMVKGTDGRVRSAKIQIAGERSKGKVFRRPLKLLVLLEIACKEANTEANQVNAPIAPAQQADRTITRSKRAAAKLGEFLRRDNM
eukprot:gene15994-7327_t